MKTSETAKRFALITGGSSGIGLAIANELASRGYSLLLVSNQKEQLAKLETKLSRQYQVGVIGYYSDLSKPSAAKEILDFCHSNQLDVEVLVNNAGFFFFGTIAEADIDSAQNMIQVHVTTPSLLCSLFSSEMIKNGKGFILNNSSISAFKHFPGIGYYGSTKSYLKSFTRSLHAELKPHGVHVTCLLPGATATDLYDPNIINVELGKKLGVMLSAEFVAKKAVNALFKNRAEVVPGMTTKLMLILARAVPYSLIGLIAKHTNWIK